MSADWRTYFVFGGVANVPLVKAIRPKLFNFEKYENQRCRWS